MVPVLSVGSSCYLSAALALLQSMPWYKDMELVVGAPDDGIIYSVTSFVIAAGTSKSLVSNS